MTEPLSLNTPDSDTAPVNPHKLSLNGVFITPKRLTFNYVPDQDRRLSATNKRRAASAESPSVQMIARKKGSRVKRARALVNGEAQIEIARVAHRLGTLAMLPNELILKILRMLEYNTLKLHYQRVQDYGLVCLALSSIDFYKICKAVHPGPLPTTRGDGARDEDGKYWAWSLERHISDFLGPSYKVREPDSRYGFYTRYGSPFLLKDADVGGSDQAKASNPNDVF